MKYNKSEVSIFFSDEFIGYVHHSEFKNEMKSGEIKLNSGVIANGYIIEPTILLSKIKKSFNNNKIKPKHVRMVIHEQNIVMRQKIILKSDLNNKSLEEYVKSELGVSIQSPFKKTSLMVHEKEQLADSIVVVIFLVDENHIQNYLDLFKYLKVKEVVFELPSVALYRLTALAENALNTSVEHIDSKKKFTEKATSQELMIVTLYNRGVSVRIIEDHTPVFGLIEEYDGLATHFYELIENYIERISNYYKYNIHKGKRSISKVVIFNFSEKIDDSILKTKFVNSEELQFHVFEIENINKQLETVSKSCYMSYGASIKPEPECPIKIKANFNLKLSNNNTQYMHYLMTVSFAIFSGISLIYIPIVLNTEQINVQTNINNNLKNQLETLQTEYVPSQEFTQLDKNYSIAYDFLRDNEINFSKNISDLFEALLPEVEILSYEISHEDKTIKLILASNEAWRMHEYIVQLYETHGVIPNSDESSRWMISQPISKELSITSMEVTIYYA